VRFLAGEHDAALDTAGVEGVFGPSFYSFATTRRAFVALDNVSVRRRASAISSSCG